MRDAETQGIAYRDGRRGGSGRGVEVREPVDGQGRDAVLSSLRNRYGDKAGRSKGPISMARNPFGGRVGG